MLHCSPVRPGGFLTSAQRCLQRGRVGRPALLAQCQRRPPRQHPEWTVLGGGCPGESARCCTSTCPLDRAAPTPPVRPIRPRSTVWPLATPDLSEPVRYGSGHRPEARVRASVDVSAGQRGGSDGSIPVTRSRSRTAIRTEPAGHRPFRHRHVVVEIDRSWSGPRRQRHRPSPANRRRQRLAATTRGEDPRVLRHVHERRLVDRHRLGRRWDAEQREVALVSRNRGC